MAKYLLKAGSHKEGDGVFSAGFEGDADVYVESDRDLVKVFGREKFGYDRNAPPEETDENGVTTAAAKQRKGKKFAALEDEGVTYDGGLKIDPQDADRNKGPQRASKPKSKVVEEEDEAEVEGLTEDDDEDEGLPEDGEPVEGEAEGAAKRKTRKKKS